MTRVEIESQLVVARESLPGSARRALARQAGVEAPVKLALAKDGRLELRAEVLRRGGRDAAKLARGALDAGRAWLVGAAPRHPGATPPRDELAGGLDELPATWAWESDDQDGFHVHASAAGAPLRLAVRSLPGGAQVTVRSAVLAGGDASRTALLHFALESNARLRLARLSLSAEADGPIAVSWEAVVPADALCRDLRDAALAVVGANVATAQSLRALGEDAVARHYLALQR